ncbi:MAG TPA: ABC transporter permease [Candidatus Saccharimonadales bacterium]
MRLLFLENFRTARESLRRTRTRTLLTITGVAIGVASITTILALSTGVTNIINRQVAELGDNLALVRPTTPPSGLIDLANPTPTTSYTTSPIAERDLQSIKSIKQVESAVPLMTLSGAIKSDHQHPKNATILATTPDFIKTTSMKIKDGQFIDNITLESTVVLGESLAVDLFGTDRAIGKSLTIRGETFTCIGIIKRSNSPINYNNVDLDHSAIISFDSGKLFNEGIAQIQQINVKAKTGTDIESLRHAISSILVKNHGGQQDTSVLIRDEIAQPTSRLFLLINTVMSLIAGISLLVGGIGIMNIMLVSVAERTREIGLRKAVGASTSSIVSQFLIEALITSFLGGLLGYVAGYGIAFMISLFLPYDPVFSWEIAALSFGLAVGVGILFGLYPAIKAARKNPIESLRRLH